MAENSYKIPPETCLAGLALNVGDLERSIDFYRDVIGLEVIQSQAEAAGLGVDGRELLSLHRVENPVTARRTTGLYHFAILTPDRVALAHSLKRLVETQWPLDGAADHLVSEALYLSDPEGNGIEIYRDRPRSEWPLINGELRMENARLDLGRLLEEISEDSNPWQGLRPETIIGHIHLRVADIPQAEAFYCDILGFELMQRYGSSASFVAAGDYHHHIGFNTWESAGATPPPPEATGLRYYNIRLPRWSEIELLVERLRAAGKEVELDGGEAWTQDPSKNRLLLSSTETT
jgi:catechol 2,3-dioxygenase